MIDQHVQIWSYGPVEVVDSSTLEAGSVHLLTVPWDDDAFRACLEEMLARRSPGPYNETALLVRIDRELQRHYPGAVLRSRRTLMGFPTESPVWFAYRDGR